MVSTISLEIAEHWYLPLSNGLSFSSLCCFISWWMRQNCIGRLFFASSSIPSVRLRGCSYRFIRDGGTLAPTPFERLVFYLLYVEADVHSYSFQSGVTTCRRRIFDTNEAVTTYYWHDRWYDVGAEKYETIEQHVVTFVSTSLTYMLCGEKCINFAKIIVPFPPQILRVRWGH